MPAVRAFMVLAAMGEHGTVVSSQPTQEGLDDFAGKVIEATLVSGDEDAALAVAGTSDPELLSAYLYSRAQSVMGGTSQIQKNIIASRILGLGV